jgi:hypothetical protein
VCSWFEAKCFASCAGINPGFGHSFPPMSTRSISSNDGRELKEIVYANGDKYVGRDDWQRVVTSLFNFRVGEYKQQRDGRGIYYYKDGSRYEGEYLSGKKHGKGMYTFPNGDKLLGIWQDNEYVGEGIMSFDNGDHYEGTLK